MKKKNELRFHPLSLKEVPYCSISFLTNSPKNIMSIANSPHFFSRWNQAHIEELPQARLKLRFWTIWHKKSSITCRSICIHYCTWAKDLAGQVGPGVRKERELSTMDRADTSDLLGHGSCGISPPHHNHPPYLWEPLSLITSFGEKISASYTCHVTSHLIRVCCVWLFIEHTLLTA